MNITEFKEMIMTTPIISVPEEQVLVFPRSRLEEVGMFQGFIRANSDYFNMIWGNRDRTILPSWSFEIRRIAEFDPARKQPIPYILFYDPRIEKIFSYYRCKKSGEERLRGNVSIGIGGHINSDDGDRPKYLERDEQNKKYVVCLDYPLVRCVFREVAEETTADPHDFQSELRGYINDDSDKVGKVHFGIVLVAAVDWTSFTARPNAGIADHRWRSIDEFTDDLPLESWSKICLDAIRAGDLSLT